MMCSVLVFRCKSHSLIMTNTKSRYYFNLKDTKKEVTEKLNNLNYTLKFEEEFIPKSFEDVLNYALPVVGRLNRTLIVRGNKHILQDIGASRSIEDLYLLCKYYCPKIKFSTIVEYIYKSNRFYMVVYCGSFRRFMFRRQTYNVTGYQQQSTRETLNKHFK